MTLFGNGWMRLWIVASVAWMVGYSYINNWEMQSAWEIGGWATAGVLLSCHEAPDSQLCKDETASEKKKYATQRMEHLTNIFGPPTLILIGGLAVVWVARGFRGKK